MKNNDTIQQALFTCGLALLVGLFFFEAENNFIANWILQ